MTNKTTNISIISFLWKKEFSMQIFYNERQFFSLPPTITLVRAQIDEIYICVMISHWGQGFHSFAIFLKVIYDDMQHNNRSVLTYDRQRVSFTTLWGSWNKPFEKRGNKILFLYVFAKVGLTIISCTPERLIPTLQRQLVMTIRTVRKKLNLLEICKNKKCQVEINRFMTLTGT